MPIAFLGRASLLCALLFAMVPYNEGLFASDTIPRVTKPSRSNLEVKTEEGVRYLLNVERDATVSPKSGPTEVRVVGEIKGSAIIFIDSYRSVPGGMSYCQAGQERFVRAFAVSKKPPREMWRVKLESCHDNIELASPGVEWAVESFTLTIHWLLGPTITGQPEEWMMRVSQENKVE